jgi:hypothetical protein
MYKQIVIAVVLALGLSAPVMAQETIVTTKIEAGRSFWGKVKDAAREVVSLGMAQTATQVQANKPFSVAADHAAYDPGLEADGYKLYIDGNLSTTVTVAAAWVGNSATPTVPGVVTITNVLLSKGLHTITMKAYNAFADSDPSNALSLSAVPGKPKAPTNARLVGPLP